MSIRNYKTKCYVPPIGEDLQHDFCDDGVSIHSDVTLLSRLSDMRLSQSLMDGILSRFTELKDDMPKEIQEKFSALDDFKKMDINAQKNVRAAESRRADEEADYTGQMTEPAEPFIIKLGLRPASSKRLR
jgi:hypothetical protein